MPELTDKRIIEYALLFLAANVDEDIEEDLEISESEIVERIRNIVNEKDIFISREQEWNPN